MSITIDTTFVVSIRHKQKMLLALEETGGVYSFIKRKVIETSDNAGLMDLKNAVRIYIDKHIAPLISCQIGIKMHEFLEHARTTAYVEILFKDQFKLKNAKLFLADKAAKIKTTAEVKLFLHQFFQEKKKLHNKS